jgi:hypothetical protein
VKLGIAIGAALALAVVAFLGLRSVLSDPEGEALDSADAAIELIEGAGSELESRLEEAGYDAEGEEAFQGVETSIDADQPQLPELDEEAGAATARTTGTATLTLPAAAGESDRELLLFDGATEESVPIELEVGLAEGKDGWEVESVSFDDPYPRPAEPLPAEVENVSGTAENVASGALSLLGPGFYEQPDVYATETDAPKEELLDARADNDPSYPPYLVDVPQSDLITGPVDRALVTAMGCEYNTATAELGRLAESVPAQRPGILQVAEFRGSATVRPTSVSCRRGQAPQLPLDAAFAVQLARSRLSADSNWHVTRFVLQFEGGQPRDVYHVADVTADDRDPDELLFASSG